MLKQLVYRLLLRQTRSRPFYIETVPGVGYALTDGHRISRLAAFLPTQYPCVLCFHTLRASRLAPLAPYRGKVCYHIVTGP